MSKSRTSKMNGYSALIGKKKPEKCIYDKKSLTRSANPNQAVTK